MKIERVEQRTDSKELLPQIIDRIFLTCKNDPNFRLKDEMEIVENKIQALLKKIEKQDHLLEESNKIKEDLKQRLDILENANNNKQLQLLEELGSEL